MDFEKIKEEEILKKIRERLLNLSESIPPEPEGEALEKINQEILQSLGMLEKVKDPTRLPQDTRLRLFKRIIQRFMRPYTRGQIEFNRIVMDILHASTREIQKTAQMFQQNTQELIAHVKNLRNLIEENLTALEYVINKTKEIEVLHKRITDENKTQYELMETIQQNLEHMKESLHDRINQSLQSIHKRIEDEKKGIIESLPSYGTVDHKTQEAKDHAAKLVKAASSEIKELEGKISPENIFRLYQAQNSVYEEIYFQLEENFRGTDEYVKEKQDFYKELLVKHHAGLKDEKGYYLDIGSGRGELLKLLQSCDIPARGVDNNQKMVEFSKKQGLNVELAEANEFLGKMADGELRGAIALQMIEHLSIRDLFKLITLAHKKLKKNGLFVVETVNPESVYAMRWFYLDYTHNKPLPAPLVRFFFLIAGFRDVEIILRSPVEGWKQMAITGDQETLDSNFHKLNNFLYGYQDYALKGIK